MCHKPIGSRGKHGTSEKQANKSLALLPIGICLTTAKNILTRQIESHPFRGRLRLKKEPQQINEINQEYDGSVSSRFEIVKNLINTNDVLFL